MGIAGVLRRMYIGRYLPVLYKKKILYIKKTAAVTSVDVTSGGGGGMKRGTRIRESVKEKKRIYNGKRKVNG